MSRNNLIEFLLQKYKEWVCCFIQRYGSPGDCNLADMK